MAHCTCSFVPTFSQSNNLQLPAGFSWVLHLVGIPSMRRPIVLRGLKVAVSTKGKYSNNIQGIRALQVVANPGYTSSHRSIKQITKGYSLPTVVALIKILMFEIVFQLKLVRTKLHNNTRLREIWLSYSLVTSWTQCQTSRLSFHRTTFSKPVASSCCHSTGSLTS